MDAKQLRIGNYVYAQSGKLVVNRDSIYKVENVNMQSARKYKPIPLTEEWLLRLGFDFVPDLHAYADENHYIVPFHDGTFQFHPFCTNDEDCWKTLEYVHQLQNLYFALTGEELQIK